MTNTDWTGTPTPYAPGLTGVVIIPGDEPVKDILLAFRGTWLTEFHPDSDDAEWRKWVPVGTDVGPVTEHLTVRWPELRFTAGRHPYRAVFAAGNHLWMFRGDRYLKLDMKTGKLATAPDADPATEIAIGDKDFVHGITAATAISDTEVYLFNNLDYYKYNLDTGHYSARMTLDVKDKLVWVTTQRLDTVCFDARNSSTSSLRLLYFVEACDGELKTENGGEELKVGPTAQVGDVHSSMSGKTRYEGPFDRLFIPRSTRWTNTNVVVANDVSTASVLSADTPNKVDFTNPFERVEWDTTKVEATAYPRVQRRVYDCVQSTIESHTPSMNLQNYAPPGVKTTLANGEMRIQRAQVIAGDSRLLVCGTKNGQAAVAVPKTAALDSGSALEEKDTYLDIEPGKDIYTAAPTLNNGFCIVTQSGSANGTLHWFAPQNGTYKRQYKAEWPALIGLTASFDGAFLYYIAADAKSLCRAEVNHWTTPTPLHTYDQPVLSPCDPVTPPDNRLIAVGRTDGKVDLHFTSSTGNAAPVTVSLPDGGAVTALTVDPNGNRLFTYAADTKQEGRANLFVIDIEAPVPSVIHIAPYFTLVDTTRSWMALGWQH